MHTNLKQLALGIFLSGLGLTALPALADNPYMGNYGAGYVPSPTMAQMQTPASSGYPATYSELYPTAYGKGFITSPGLVPGNGSPLIISTSNYGSGFLGSPDLYGANITATIYTGNYGAGFLGSPNIVRSYSPFRVGYYGAGFIPSPPRWYGYGFFGF